MTSKQMVSLMGALAVIMVVLFLLSTMGASSSSTGTVASAPSQANTASQRNLPKGSETDTVEQRVSLPDATVQTVTIK